MNNNIGFTLMHNLQCVDHKIWPGDLISGKVVAIGGTFVLVMSHPNFFLFDDEELNLFVRVHLPLAPLLQPSKNTARLLAMT
jgi:hypothetical protein